MNVELVIGNVKLFALRAMLNFSITNYICRRHSLFNIQYSIALLAMRSLVHPDKRGK
jgi:hypothetical protein